MITRNSLIESIVDFLRNHCRTEEERKIGVEYEQTAVCAKTGKRIPYFGENGIETFLTTLAQDYGEIVEKQDEHILGLKTANGIMTLEPGAQIEIASNARKDLHIIAKEWRSHLKKMIEVGEQFGYKWLAIGVEPFHRALDVPIIPKNRYKIMADYLCKTGTLAPEMMRLTTSIQVNLDYINEQDALAILRTGLAVSPYVTALFANSPLLEKRPCGFLSYRTHIWDNMDPARCGFLGDFLDQDKVGFADYAELVVDLPLIFRYDDHDEVIAAGGMTMIDWLGMQEYAATPEQVKIVLQQFFTEVRLKSLIEFRGIDCPPPQLTLAVPALWLGLMYSKASRDKAWKLCSMLSEKRYALWQNVAVKGLEAENGKVREIAGQLIELAEAGLKERGVMNEAGQDESIYLRPLVKMLKEGKNPAQKILDSWHKHSEQNIAKFLEEISYNLDHC